jgi:hypothetical protein
VVKDPTQPGPSLVTEVKDSSLTILSQSQVDSTGSERGSAHQWGFPAEGALEELVPFDLERWRSFRGPNPLGFDYWAKGAFLSHFGGVLSSISFIVS